MRRAGLLAMCACVLSAAVACAVGASSGEDAGTTSHGSVQGNDSGSDAAKQGDAKSGDGQTTCPSPQTFCAGDGGGCFDLTSDPNHCGGCGKPCATTDAGDLEAGSNGNPDNGLPQDGGADTGAPWSEGTATCTKNTCGVSCPTSMTLCTDELCYDTQQFHDHCGNCNTACAAGEWCGGGHCCATGSTYCGTACAAVLSDPNNCGTCNHQCPGGESCVAGSCTTCSNANVALTATATSSGGGTTTYGPADLNNGVLETTSCTAYEWTTAGNTPGTAFIQYTWPSAMKLTKMHMDTTSATVADTCGNSARTLGGATVQWWNGTSWVTDGTVSGKQDDWDYTFTTQITTTQVRLYAIYVTSTQGQLSNPIAFEWQVTGCN